MTKNTEGPKKPTDADIDAAFREEHAAALAFAKLCRQETALAIKKIAARHRLSMAREKKRELLADLMAL